MAMLLRSWLSNPRKLSSLSSARPVRELTIKRDDAMEQPLEECFALGCECHGLVAAVLRRALASHETVPFHAVQVMGDRGAFDADRGGEVTLHGVVGALDRQQDQPRR
jgi:hypothetical protein